MLGEKKKKEYLQAECWVVISKLIFSFVKRQSLKECQSIVHFILKALAEGLTIRSSCLPRPLHLTDHTISLTSSPADTHHIICSSEPFFNYFLTWQAPFNRSQPQ